MSYRRNSWIRLYCFGYALNHLSLQCICDASILIEDKWIKCLICFDVDDLDITYSLPKSKILSEEKKYRYSVFADKG